MLGVGQRADAEERGEERGERNEKTEERRGAGLGIGKSQMGKLPLPMQIGPSSATWSLSHLED